ncbi:hypothetical protein BT93_G2387 [Corymbia citriodora subsp. variegata]|nr:hypothetical protein BT93_G2387 [Corymbia citriodora subsp. variegata]
MASTTSTGLTHFQLTSVKLDGTNYPSWSKAVQVYLTATKQNAYLTSTLPSDTSKISPHFIQCNSAKEVWDKCALLYSGQNNMTRKDLRVILFLKALGPEYSSLRQQITSESSLPTIDEVFSRALRSTPTDKISTTTLETSAMISHGSSGRGAHGRGYRGHGRGLIQSGSRGGRDRSIGGRGSRYCNHCRRAGHTEAYCYTLHPELRPTVAAFAKMEDSSSPIQPVPTNV